MRGPAVLRGGVGRGLAGRGPVGSRGVSAGLTGLFAQAQVYIDAARNGGSGVNEGTAGSDYDATVALVDPATEKAAGFGGMDIQAATTPDAADIDLTAGYVVAFDIHPLAWRASQPEQIMSKSAGGGDATHDCYAVSLEQGGDGNINFEWNDSVGGHTTSEFGGYSIASDAGRLHLCVEFIGDNGAGGWTANLYEVDGGTDATLPDGGGLTLLDTVTDTGTQTITTSSEVLKVGNPLTGAVYRLRLYDSMGGSLLRDFYPDRDWTSGTTMTSGSSVEEVWSNLWIPDTEDFVAASVPTGTALDVGASDDATLAFWFDTPFLADADGENYIFADRSTGQLGQDGDGFIVRDVKIDAFTIDDFRAIVGDGTNQAVAGSNTGWAAGDHLVVLTIDRSGPTLTLYRDGTEHATGDITSVGAMDPAAVLRLLSASHHAFAKWDEVLDPADVAAARP